MLHLWWVVVTGQGEEKVKIDIYLYIFPESSQLLCISYKKSNEERLCKVSSEDFISG